MDTVTAYPVLKAMEEASELAELGNLDSFVPNQDIKKLFASPDVDREKILELKSTIENSIASGKPDFKIRIVDRFGRALTDDQLSSWFGEDD